MTDPRIPFLDLGRSLERLGPDLELGVRRVLASGTLLDGPEVPEFEAEWATRNGAAHAVGVGSGTDALRLSLLALEIGSGDEVIVPAFTAVPTIAAVAATGATPVPVDVDAETGLLDHRLASEAVTERTRAAIVVHLFGLPSAVPDLGVPVIEDAAHAHGALRRISGLVAAYSFYPTKNLSTIGDGGAIVTDDAELAERVRMLRAHGRDDQGIHRHASTNSRLSEIGAAALLVGLPLLDEGNRRRSEIAAAYRSAAPSLGWQPDHPDHCHHLCVARVRERESFRRELPCETAVHYPRALVDEPAYSEFMRAEVPSAQAWAAECVSLPCYPDLEDREVETISSALSDFEASGRFGR